MGSKSLDTPQRRLDSSSKVALSSNEGDSLHRAARRFEQTTLALLVIFPSNACLTCLRYCARLI